jgi:hypothetical protein
MTAPLAPIALYARLAEASADLSCLLQHLDIREDHPLWWRVEQAWRHLDDLIEQLPDALAADATRQDEEDTP